MKVRTLALRATPFALVAAFALAAASGSSAKTGADFTAAQAKAGEKTFDAQCSRCHGVNLQGISAPALRGAASGLHGDSVADAYSFISVQMPAGNPGGLTTTEYLDVVAYILSRNGHAAGPAALTVKSAAGDKTHV